MAYKPQNVAKFREDSSTYPKGSSTGKGGGVVPGTTGSDDRGSQFKDFLGNGDHANVNEQGGSDYSFFMNNGDNQDTKSRGKEGFGQATYNYNKPTL